NGYFCYDFFFRAEDGIRDFHVTGVQTCALPIYFILQPTKWVAHKEAKKTASPYLYLHTLIHTGLCMLFLWDLDLWWIAVLVGGRDRKSVVQGNCDAICWRSCRTTHRPRLVHKAH